MSLGKIGFGVLFVLYHLYEPKNLEIKDTFYTQIAEWQISV